MSIAVSIQRAIKYFSASGAGTSGDPYVLQTQSSSAAATSTTLQSAASANGNGTAVSVDGLATIVFQVAITGTATVNFEASNDSWVTTTPLLATLVGSGTIANSTTTSGYCRASVAGLKAIRARISGVSGTPSVTVVAYITSVNAANKVVSLANPTTLADALALPSTQLFGAPGMLYNGATLDLQRSNYDFTALTSATRTAQTDSAEFTNYNFRGCVVYLRITAASGTGGLQLRMLTRDPAGGAQLFLNSPPTAVTTTGTGGYVFYPGATSGGGITQLNSCPLPRLFMIRVSHGDSSNYTYSVGVSLIL